jgi:hypothetical protein
MDEANEALDRAIDAAPVDEAAAVRLQLAIDAEFEAREAYENAEADVKAATQPPAPAAKPTADSERRRRLLISDDDDEALVDESDAEKAPTFAPPDDPGKVDDVM